MYTYTCAEDRVMVKSDVSGLIKNIPFSFYVHIHAFGNVHRSFLSAIF